MKKYILITLIILITLSSCNRGNGCPGRITQQTKQEINKKS